MQYEAGEEQEEKRSSMHSLRRRYFVMRLVAALGSFLLVTAGLFFCYLSCLLILPLAGAGDAWPARRRRWVWRQKRPRGRGWAGASIHFLPIVLFLLRERPPRNRPRCNHVSIVDAKQIGQRGESRLNGGARSYFA